MDLSQGVPQKLCGTGVNKRLQCERIESMKILAIFTCHNRRELTKRGIETLALNKEVQFDFVVVDDGSTDGTVEMLKSLPAQIDVVEGDGNLFWNRGMHKGIEYVKEKYSDYEYYMLMNDDTKFFEGIFDEMKPQLKKDTVLVGAICGDKGELSYGGIKYVKGIRYKKYGPEAQDISFDTFNANCAIIPHDIFMQVGIDPFYQHSIGDFDYGLQISKKGYDIRVYSKYVGECNDNTLQRTWQDETLPKLERIKLKESRKGLPFTDWFHFLRKNFGLGTAIVRSITPYIRILLGTKTRYSGS